MTTDCQECHSFPRSLHSIQEKVYGRCGRSGSYSPIEVSQLEMLLMLKIKHANDFSWPRIETNNWPERKRNMGWLTSTISTFLCSMLGGEEGGGQNNYSWLKTESKPLYLLLNRTHKLKKRGTAGRRMQQSNVRLLHFTKPPSPQSLALNVTLK